MKKAVFFILCILSAMRIYAQSPAYKNPDLPVDTRVEDLLARMNADEKFWQLYMTPDELKEGHGRYVNGVFGLQIRDASPQQLNNIQRAFVEETRLGIPVIFFEEGLHGLVHKGSTVFPQAIGLAASWDTSLMHEVASAIAAECKAVGIRQVLSPVLNIARDQRWGRTEETYGEDPLLTSLMAHAYITEMEQSGIIATPKHFAVNVGDGGRDSYPIHLDELLLEEIYFPAFKTAVQKAGAHSVMASYNSLNGSPCSANAWLLDQKLRNEWGFRGVVISDACGVGGANVLHFTASDYAEATRNALNNGLDVIFQTSYDHHGLFKKAFDEHMIAQDVIDNGVRHVLRVKFEMGLFDRPYVKEDTASSNKALAAHRELALKAAEQSMVLLKNDSKTLPLSKDIHTLAVIGKDAALVNLGGYSGPGGTSVSIVEGLKKMLGSEKVLYAEGCGHSSANWKTIDSTVLFVDEGITAANGLRAEYFDNIALSGTPGVSRRELQLSGQWTLFAPDTSLLQDWFSARWSGILKVPFNGPCRIGLEGNDGYRLYIDDSLMIDNWKKVSFGMQWVDLDLQNNRSYTLKVEYYETSGNGKLRLVWDAGVADSSQTKMQEALALAKRTDAVLVVCGIEEGEFRDRARLELPGGQGQMIRELADAGKPLIVVLTGGSAVDVSSWEKDADAIVEAWYSGDEGGTALARLLFGEIDPSGRLPFSWPMEVGQLPLVYDHQPTGRGDDYVDLSGMPRYPFGYGLSYTRFEYSDLQLSTTSIKAADTLFVNIRIKNTGDREGAEIVQLYVHDEIASVVRPVKELKAFQRVELKPGEQRSVKFALPPSAFSFYGSDHKEVIEPGDIKIMIGASSADIRLRGSVTIK